MGTDSRQLTLECGMRELWKKLLNKLLNRLLDMALGSKAFVVIVTALWACFTVLAHRFFTNPLMLPAPWGAIAAGYIIAITAVACWLAIRIIRTSRKLDNLIIVDTDLWVEWRLYDDINWWLRVDARKIGPEVFKQGMIGPFCATKGCGSIAIVRYKINEHGSLILRSSCLRCSRGSNYEGYEEVAPGDAEKWALLELQRQYRIRGAVKRRMIIASLGFRTEATNSTSTAAPQ
jgi:hypothetical protein